MPDILEFISLEQANPIEFFLSKVANSSLTLAINQPFYSRIVNFVLLTDLTAEIVNCSILERKILISAATVYHLSNLNKSMVEISNLDNLKNVLIDYNLDQLLMDIEDCIEVVHQLIIRAKVGNQVVKQLSSNSIITEDRLNKILVPLLQLVDHADVAREFSDKDKQDEVLMKLNALSGTQYRWVWHHLNEYRGSFTNLIHNAVMKQMQKQLLAKPFFNYSDGTLYLIPANSSAKLSDSIYTEVAKDLSQSLKRLKGGNAADFVIRSQIGIKINPEIFSTDLSIADAFEIAARITQALPYQAETIADMEAKAIKRADDGYEELLVNKQLFSRDVEVMRMGELLRTIYNFLQSHCSKAFKGKNKFFNSSWEAIYQKFSLEVDPRWALVDGLCDRAYVIAKVLKEESLLDFSQVLSQVVELAEEFIAKLQLKASEDKANPSLIEYLEATLTFDSIKKQQSFIKNLNIYNNPKIDSCCLCSLALEGQEMLSGAVPTGIVVSQYSNRNKAGSGDLKRHYCAICREQLLVEKIGFASGQSKSFYLHIFPDTLASPIFVNAMRNTFKSLNNVDVRTLLFDTRTIARDYEDNKLLRLSFKSKSTGLALPLYPELVGNIITLPIYPLGDNDTERYLFALHYALLIYQRFGQRVVLTQSIISPITGSEMLETNADDSINLYLDDLPNVMDGLIPSNSLNRKQANDAFELLHALKVIADKIGTGKDLINLVRSLKNGELGIYLATHRAIERNSKNGAIANSKAGDVNNKLSYVANKVFESKNRGGDMSKISLKGVLEKMAEIAWKRAIKGSSLATSSLIKPIEIAFHILHRQSNKEIDFIKLVVTGEITDHLGRISEYKLGADRAASIEQWVSIFFDELLNQGFDGDIRRFFHDEKAIKSAYTTLMRTQLRRASEAKKANNQLTIEI